MGLFLSSYNLSTMVKAVLSRESVSIPAGVDVNVKARLVTIKGPLGTLTKSFRHTSVDVKIIPGKEKKLVFELWFGNKKQVSTLNTCAAHIKNMINGVTKGYEYKMRLIYAHFPISATVVDNDKEIELRNFLGEKYVRRIKMLEGVTVKRTDVKDEIALTGTNLEAVSQSAALIHQSVLVKKKDIRKFLDGVYVSSKRVVEAD